MKTITVSLHSENKDTGQRRWHVQPGNLDTLFKFIGGDYSKVRGFRAHKNGGFGFTSGGGYDFIDADMLGGNGSGETRRCFEDEHDVSVLIVKDRTRKAGTR